MGLLFNVRLRKRHETVCNAHMCHVFCTSRCLFSCMKVLIRAGGIRKNRCDYEAALFGMFATTVLADLIRLERRNVQPNEDL